MREPRLGDRQEPIGADDVSSDEWDEEEFEDDYDTPENILGARGRGEDLPDGYEEGGEDLYDVPEFMPDAISGPDVDRGPRPVPRDMKPGKQEVMCSRKEPPLWQEEYEAPQDTPRTFPPPRGGRVNALPPPATSTPEVQEEYLVAADIVPERPFPRAPKPKAPFNGRMEDPRHPLPTQNPVARAFDNRTRGPPPNINFAADENEDQYLAAAPVTPTRPPVGPRGQAVGRDSPRDVLNKSREVLKPSAPSRDDRPAVVPRLNAAPNVMPKTVKRPVPTPMAPADEMYEVTDTCTSNVPPQPPTTAPEVTSDEFYEIASDTISNTRAPVAEPRRSNLPPKPAVGKKPTGFKGGMENVSNPPETGPKPSSIKERLAMLQKLPGAPNPASNHGKEPVRTTPEDYESMNGRQVQAPLRTSFPPKPGKLSRNVVPEGPQETYEVMGNSTNVEGKQENYEVPDPSTVTEPEFYEIAGEEPPPRAKMPPKPSFVPRNQPVVPRSPVEQENYEVPADTNASNNFVQQETYETPDDREPIRPSGTRPPVFGRMPQVDPQPPVVHEQEDYEVVSTDAKSSVVKQDTYEVQRLGNGVARPSGRPDTAATTFENNDSDEDYIEPNERGPKKKPSIQKREVKTPEAKRDPAGASVKRTGIGQKLRKSDDFTIAKKIQMELGSFFGGGNKKEKPPEKFSGTGGSKPVKPLEKPISPVTRESGKDDDAILSVDDLAEAFPENASPKPSPKPTVDPRHALPPPKPRHSASFEESLEEVMAHSEWYHREIKREVAESKLKQHRTEGMFLVRDTEKGPGYSLSFFASGSVRHLRIQLDVNTKNYNLGSYDHKFGSVVQLIKYFQDNAFELKVRKGGDSKNGGLAKLIKPCPQ